MQIFHIPKDTKVLIFDIDSTLYTNENYAHEQIDCQIRHFAELRRISADEARSMIAGFRREWAKTHGGQKISLGNLLTHFGISIQESIEWRKTLFDPKDFLCEDKKLRETIEILSKKYYPLCVTNNPVLQGRRTLEALGVSEFFDVIVGLDSTLKSKPAEENLTLALELAEKATGKTYSNENAVSIGDRYDIDLCLPLKMGMGAILVGGVSDVYLLPGVLR